MPSEGSEESAAGKTRPMDARTYRRDPWGLSTKKARNVCVVEGTEKGAGDQKERHDIYSEKH